MGRPKCLILKLEKQSGPGAAAEMSLKPGQRASVGRTNAADLSLPDDEQLSRIHFALEYEGAACRIHDLGSSNGTLLNGARIEEAVLQPGDTIRAGQTTFRVHFEGATTQRRSTIIRKRGSTSRLAPARPAGSTSAPPQARARKRSVILARSKSVELKPTPPAAEPSRRVCLEIESGSLQGHKVWLRPGQRVDVGRSHRADWVIPGDASISQRHFAVELGPDSCRVFDLGSSYGTFVNGVKGTEAIVRDGDLVLAGKTTFRVNAESASDVASQAPVASQICRTTDCPSGIVQFHGCQCVPTEIARTLARLFRLYLIVDYRKLTMPPPPNPIYLLDWVPPSAAARMSPIFIPPSEHLDPITIVERAWDKDAVACIYSMWDTPQVLAHLRVVARGQHGPNAIPKPEQMLGFCNPSSLRALLVNCTPKFARYLFAGIGAILIEAPSPESWELLAGIGFAVRLVDVQDPKLRQLFGQDYQIAPRRRAKRPSTSLGRRRAKSQEFRDRHR